MMSGRAFSLLHSRRGLALVLAGGIVLLSFLSAAAQEQKPAPANPPAPAQDYAPGILDSVGRWLKDAFSRLGSNVEGARGTLGDLGGRATEAAKRAANTAQGAADTARNAAKEAADAVARLPNARVVNGRERCAVAANGAPDCRRAAEAVCRSKGFGSGTSLDIQSAQKCPARVWLSRRQPEPGECDVESFVTRAVCQ
jgi:hypothetical protein